MAKEAELQTGTIKTFADTFLNTRSTLKDRWDTDFNLWRQKPYSAGKGYVSYTSNSARILVDKLVAILGLSNLLIRIPMDDLLGDDRKIASNVERFLYGALNLNDERLARIGQPSLRDALSWLFSVRGGVALLTYVYKNEAGKTITKLAPWDLYSTAYEFGEDGVRKAVHKRMATRESILKEYPNLESKISLWQKLTGGGKPTDNIAVYNYFDDKDNAIVVGTEWAKEPEPHGCDGCPVDIIKVGAMPSVLSTSKEALEMEAFRGESSLAANRHLYPVINKLLSDYATIIRRGVKTPMVLKSADGKTTLEGDMYQVEKASVIPMRREDSLEPAMKQTMPQEAAALLSIVSAEIERGGLPASTYGELRFRLSGYALSQLQQAIVTAITSLTIAMERAYTGAANRLIEQFADGGFEPVEVTGETSRGEKFGVPQRLKIKSSDLKKDWRPEVRFVAQLPKDDAQMMNLANIARMGEEPLLSMDTIRDEYLGIQDPDLERTKIEEEWGKNIPIVRLQKTFQAYVERGEFHLASLVLQEMQKYMQAMEAQLPKQTPVTGGEGPNRGMSPETMPYEETVETPPQVANAGAVTEEAT